MEPAPKPKLREGCFKYAAIYTGICFLIPVTIYTSNTLFTRFCAFHNRIFTLKGRSHQNIFGLAVGVSILYSTITLNLYYRGLLSILGISSIYDIEGIISDNFLEDLKSKESNSPN